MKRFLAIGWLLAAITSAAAQPYPSRPITMVVPFGAGGPTDALARIVAQRMSGPLGQTVLVENVTGASGTIGIGRVARAAPDGYTIVLGNWPSFVVASAIYPSLPYDVTKDFEPIALLPNNPYIVVSKKDLPAKDLKELTAYIKANSAGSADVMRDLTAGHIDISFDQAISALPSVRNGQVRAYAISGKTRLAAAPDIPTVDEAGAPGVYISTWFGLWAPKGTALDIIARLTGATMEALADPAVRARLSDLGQEIPPLEQQTAAALAAHLKAELEKWTPIIRDANIKVE